MTLRAGLILLGLGAGLLAACGGQPSSATVSRPATTAAEAPEEPAALTATEAPDSDAAEAIIDFTGFTSPSGNVGCYIDSTSARCDIAERDWPPPPRPADCEFDYGQGISLTPGQTPTFVCAGDTGVLQCESAESGITCRDTATGHGFAISREAYQVF